MQYRKIVNWLDDITNQPSKFRTNNSLEISYESRGVYEFKSDIKFKISTIKSNLCDYSEVYIHFKAPITVPNTAAADTPVKDTNNTIKNCAPFTNCVSKINNMKVDNAQDFNIVLLMYSLIEYNDVYSKTSGSLWGYYRDEPDLYNNSNIIHFPANNNNSILFKFK